MKEKVKRDDPLIGQIVTTADAAVIDFNQFMERAVKADVIYLGENHNNPDHHAIQRRIILALVKAGRHPQIGFEFFSRDQTSYLMTYVQADPAAPHALNAAAREKILRENLGWTQRDNVSWQYYFQFLQIAQSNNLRAFGADLPDGLINRLTRNGTDGLTAVERSLLRPTGFHDDNYQKLMLAKFQEAHCGMNMGVLADRMYQTWLARNDAMARSVIDMLNQKPDEPVIMIIGAGHTEHNMGVYERVEKLKPGVHQLNLGLTEISRKPSNLESYFGRETIGGRVYPPVHEILWFTQRHSYDDPCERFRDHLKQLKSDRKTP